MEDRFLYEWKSYETWLPGQDGQSLERGLAWFLVSRRKISPELMAQIQDEQE